MAPLHAILASQRSGTTLFRSILNTHPKVHAFDEVYGGFRPKRQTNYFSYFVNQVTTDPAQAVPYKETLIQLFWGHLAKLEELSPEASVRLVDIKYTHVHRFNPLNYRPLELPYLLRWIESTGGSVLHVVRKNLLETHTSAAIARHNASHRAAKADMVKETRVTLERHTIVQELEKRDLEINHFRRILKDIGQVQEIYYEDMIEDGLFSESLLSGLAQKWSIDANFQRAPEREKIAPPLNQAIANFDDIKSALADSQFAWMTDL